MLSLFPELLAFDLVGILLLRVSVGFIFLSVGWRLFAARALEQEDKQRRPGKLMGIYALATGALLTVGLYTQGAVLAGIVLSLALAHFARTRSSLLSEPLTYHLTALICLALLFLGPGAFGIDLPL